jgi:hypothetical protein
MRKSSNLPSLKLLHATLNSSFKLVLEIFSRNGRKCCLYTDILNGYLNLSRATTKEFLKILTAGMVIMSEPYFKARA